MKNAYLHLAGALVLLIAAVSAYVFWYHELSAKRAEAAAESSELATLKANAALATAASEQLSSLGSDAAEIRGYFIDPANVVPFLETLQDTGGRLGSSVTVQSVTAKNDGHPHLDLALAISGPFSAVVRTIGAIEFAPYDITLTSLTLTAASDDAGGWNAAMTFSVGTASSTPSSALPASPAESAPASTSASHAGPAFTSVPTKAP